MGFDITAARKARTGWDDAAPTTFNITDGDTIVATLGPELPLRHLAAIQDISSELMVLLTKVIEQRDDEAALVDEVMGFLVAYPDLPGQALSILGRVGRSLLGDAGYDTLLGMDLSAQDVIALIGAITQHYGVGLGESSGSTEPSPSGGTTSPTTGSTTYDSSWDEVSEPTPTTPDSSGSGPSSSTPDDSPTPPSPPAR